MQLRDEIQTITGKKRRFLLLRIADIDVKTALTICNSTQGAYNDWVTTPEFSSLYHQLDRLSSQYKQEAIQILRRDNQLAAVMLEGKIIHKIEEEIESGEYSLIKTPLAKEVYTKLIGDLDYQPKELSLTWEQRVQNLITKQPETIEGEIIEPKQIEAK